MRVATLQRIDACSDGKAPILVFALASVSSYYLIITCLLNGSFAAEASAP